jgi:ArsR family transcriptional regulator
MSELTSPFAGKPITRADAEPLAGLMKALADPARLQLLALLSSGEQTCTELIAGLGRLRQSTVSHHLGVLADAGFIVRRGGTDFEFTYNALVPAGLTAVADALRPGGGDTRG